MDERRIGRRVAVHGLTMEVVVPPPPKKRFGRAGEPRVVVVDVIDVSVSGALIAVAEPEALRVGAVVPVRLHGHEGVVRVRRSCEADRPGRARFGVEFLDAEPELREELDEIIGAVLHPDGDPRWHELHDD